MKIALDALARAIGAKMVGGRLPIQVESVGTDTRCLPARSLFVALCGPNFDGHDFVVQAKAQGAVAALIQVERLAQYGDLELPLLGVPDTQRALGDLAAWVRQGFTGKVVAVTGSNGKTTVKNLIAAGLSAFGTVARTQGNLNNLIGVPLSILSARGDEAHWVLEMGMSEPGEIRRLAQIACPDVGVVTNAGPAHLAGLGNVAHVARAKCELFEGVLPIAVVGVDGPELEAACRAVRPSGKTLRVGRRADADVRVVSVSCDAEGTRTLLDAAGRELLVSLPLLGAHQALNAAAAVGVALGLGLDVQRFAQGLATVEAASGRMRLYSARGLRIIDDTYNANPSSMRAALDALRTISAGAPAVAILGDMLELGPESPRWHREVGELCGGLLAVCAMGERSVDVVAGAQSVGVLASVCDSPETAAAQVRAVLGDGGVVLVKGSRGMRMERVVVALGAQRVTSQKAMAP